MTTENEREREREKSDVPETKLLSIMMMHAMILIKRESVVCVKCWLLAKQHSIHDHEWES